MKKIQILVLLILVLALGACEKSGPQGALDKMAKAMETNSPAQFLAQIDMREFTVNYIKSVTADSSTLSSLNAMGNAIGKALGLGSVDKILNDLGYVQDLQDSMQADFERGVASGELMVQCSKATTPDCPWVPKALSSAQIIELDASAAIAKVTTPARLTSWLALRKIGDKWLVVGQAVLESAAKNYAKAQPKQKAAPAPQKAPASKSPVNI